jgi:glycosyltransferase involved in cell wall biosynthesis
LEQHTDFQFDLLISDDCSIDGTRAILSRFEAKYAGVVKVVFQERNIGALKNFQFVHRKASGKYVAHVDGDDYLLPGKLGAQAKFLDEHPQCPMVAHRMHILSERGIVGCTARNPPKIDLRYLVENHPAFLNSSTMRRKEFWVENPNGEYIDFYIYLDMLRRGYIGFLNDIYGVYRKGIGISATLRLLDRIEEAFDYAEEIGGRELKPIIARARSRQCFSYALNQILKRDHESARKSIDKAIQYAPHWVLPVLFRFCQRWPTLLRFLVQEVKHLKQIKSGLGM